MKIVCAWCQRESESGYLGDREPSADSATTHEICSRHKRQVLEDLPTQSFFDATMLHLERVLLFRYCWGHQLQCPACGESCRVFEVNSGRFERNKRTSCVRCRADLMESVRGHLYACPSSPEGLRDAAQEARANMRNLLKQVRELRHHGGVLPHQAEAAEIELRDALKQSVSEALRRTIQLKLRDGRLPHVDAPEAILGRPGDGSQCAVCDRPIAKERLMIMIGSHPTRMPLHAADCFPLWDEERQTFQLILLRPRGWNGC